MPKKNDPAIDSIDGLRVPSKSELAARLGQSEAYNNHLNDVFKDELPFNGERINSLPGVPVHTPVGSVDSGDISGYPQKRRRTQSKHQTYKYVLGDVYRLCIASNLKEAMLVFGANDSIRVGVHSIDSQLTFDLFAPHDVIISDYDGRVILQFPFK